jgi:putative ABC transport system permease protein
MYARLLAESLRRGARRKLLALTVVALGTLGTSGLAAVLLASGDRLASEMASYGANIEAVVPPRTTLPAERLAALRKIFWQHNIVAIAPFRVARVRLEPAGLVAPVAGTWFDHALGGDWRTGLPKTRPTLQVAGHWPREGQPELVLGRRLAARAHLVPGDGVTLRLGSRSAALWVVGIVTSGGEEEEQGFTSLGALSALTDEGERFERAEVFALTTPEKPRPVDPARLSPDEYEIWYCTAYPSSIAHQIQEVLPEARVTVLRGVTGATAEVLGRLRAVLIALILVVLLSAAIGVASTMAATFLERRLEAGLLVAIGARRAHVVAFFLTESALLGAFGGLLGGAFGLPFGRWLGGRVLEVQVPWIPEIVPVTVVAGLLLAMLSSFAPVVRALERFPAETLKRATG